MILLSSCIDYTDMFWKNVVLRRETVRADGSTIGLEPFHSVKQVCEKVMRLVYCTVIWCYLLKDIQRYWITKLVIMYAWKRFHRFRRFLARLFPDLSAAFNIPPAWPDVGVLEHPGRVWQIQTDRYWEHPTERAFCLIWSLVKAMLPETKLDLLSIRTCIECYWRKLKRIESCLITLSGSRWHWIPLNGSYMYNIYPVS